MGPSKCLWWRWIIIQLTMSWYTHLSVPVLPKPPPPSSNHNSFIHSNTNHQSRLVPFLGLSSVNAIPPYSYLNSSINENRSSSAFTTSSSSSISLIYSSNIINNINFDNISTISNDTNHNESNALSVAVCGSKDNKNWDVQSQVNLNSQYQRSKLFVDCPLCGQSLLRNKNVINKHKIDYSSFHQSRSGTPFCFCFCCTVVSLFSVLKTKNVG